MTGKDAPERKIRHARGKASGEDVRLPNDLVIKWHDESMLDDQIAPLIGPDFCFDALHRESAGSTDHSRMTSKQSKTRSPTSADNGLLEPRP